MVGKLLGKGNTADVYDIGNNKVLKLFKSGYPEHAVQREFQNSKLVDGLDGNIVKSYKLISFDARYGIVYDKVDGVSMLDLLIQTQDTEKFAKALAMLHKKILSHHAERAISLKSILRDNIEETDRLSIHLKPKIIATLDRLPEGNCLCHGDFHFGNILVSQEKYYVIDYMNVCRGHRLGDIARTVYLIEMTSLPSEVVHIKSIADRLKTQVADAYLNAMGVSRQDLAEWLVVTAAARLAELGDAQTDEIDAVLEFLT